VPEAVPRDVLDPCAAAGTAERAAHRILVGAPATSIAEDQLAPQVLVERWRRHYNGVRPHSALGYRPPAPEAVLAPVAALCGPLAASAHGLGN